MSVIRADGELDERYRHRGDAKTSPRVDAQLTEKQIKALSMYVAGATFEEIARAVPYSDRSTAAKAVKRAIAAHKTVRAELADEARELQLQRLDALWRRHFAAAMGADSEERIEGGKTVRVDVYERRLKATDMLLKIWDRMNKNQGLDQPIRVEATVSTGPSDLMGEIAELSRLIQDKARADAEQAGLPAPETPAIDAVVESVIDAEAEDDEPSDG